ncbi:MAG: AMP-binding protein [Anaerolineales bacterium]|nr:AMP-binding protein [Anaerolineales bacterium]
MMHFLDRLSAVAAEQPDKLAIEFIDDRFASTSRVTYGELNEVVLQTMAMLRSYGIAPGDRVALQLPKCMPFIYLHLAIMRIGAISLPLNPGYPPRELAYFLADAEARFFFADKAVQGQIAPVVAEIDSLQECVFLDCREDGAFMQMVEGRDLRSVQFAVNSALATCLMIYTSGTTGRPKGAELTYGNLTASLDSLEVAWGWRRDDLLLHVLPIFHVHGLVVALHGALHAGASVLMCSKFDPVKTLDLLDNRRCTVFMAVPTIHRRLVDAPNADDVDLSHLRLITSGSDRLSDDLFEMFRVQFGYTLLERYGMSETSMLISNPLHGERRVGSVGLPLPGVEVRIVDPEDGSPVGDNEIGEVQVRGANVFPRYWRQPAKTSEAFTPDGWFRTGDLGLREPDGYFTLKGRSKDLIISGGYNVYPPEVELVLAEHPAILASAVIGCPDTEWGERVAAIVVRQPGATVTEAEIIDYCRQRLVAYKAPRNIVFVDDLPRNAMGKVQKADLRRMLCS